MTASPRLPVRCRPAAWMAAAVLFVGAGPLRAGYAWRQDVYVWQRRHDAAVAATLAGIRGRADGFFPLVAEVKWPADGNAEITRVRPDYAALVSTGRRIGLVLRIGPYAGSFAADAPPVKALTVLAGALLAEARQAGVAPAELQIDFDCAEDKLAGYRVWLEALRGVTGGTPLGFTALPAWLRHEAEFAALARAADGFVLQVHSLEKPTGGPDAVYALCDPKRALAWAEQAAKIGRPFRVALPTYGYRLAFDAHGGFFALSAEGPAPRWPDGTQVRVVRAEPVAMLGIAEALKTKPPAGCEGVIWFRLPVAGDRLNWDVATFGRVLAGQMPQARLEIEVRWPEPRLAEVVVINRGETSEPLPVGLRATWSGAGKLLASDGLGGFEVTRRGAEAAAELKAGVETMDSLVAPGKSRKIAWLRFSDEISLDVTVADRTP